MGLSGQPGVCRSVFQVFYRFSFSSTETIAFELKVFGKILFVGTFDPVRGRVACTSEGRGKRVSSILSVFFFGELLVRS